MRSAALLLTGLLFAGCDGAGAEVEPTPVVVANPVDVQLVLETAPHCDGCVSHIQTICEGLDGFVELEATPEDPAITVRVDGDKLDAGAVLAALTENARPGRLAD